MTAAATVLAINGLGKQRALGFSGHKKMHSAVNKEAWSKSRAEGNSAHYGSAHVQVSAPANVT